MNDEFAFLVRKVTQASFLLLSASILAWVLFDPKPLFAGWTLGLATSLWNTAYTARKIARLGEVSATGRNQSVSLGTVNRFATSLLAVMIAVRFPHIFSLIPTIAGLVVTQALAWIFALFFQIRSDRDRTRKG